MRFKQLLRKLEAPHPPGLTTLELMLSNDDLLPVPPKFRLWKWYNFVMFWLADGFNINTLMIASSMIVSGLTWWQAWISVWIGYSVAAVFLVWNGRPGAVYHIPFPVLNRASFGLFGSFWPVFNRAGMACVWTGVQTWIGGNCVYVLISAIWPSFKRIHNGIPSSGTDTAHFVSFFLFSLIQAIAVYFPIHTIRHLFTLKAITAPLAGILFFVWCIVKAGGVGPIIHQKGTLKGSALGWGFVNAVMSCISNMATLITNNPDITARSRRLSDTTWSQLITLPLVFIITSFLGIIIGSASTVIHGETVWDPLDNLGLFLNDANSATRAGVAFISIAFIIAQIGVNISANTISAGQDLTALFPRFVNIRRGGYIACLVGFAMAPWKLLESSNNFTSYLSAYSVFLASIIGVMLVDYYWVRKGALKVGDFYTPSKHSDYFYTYGVNFRAYAAYISGILINIVGFTSVVPTANPPLAAIRIYQLAFFTGLGTSALIYFLLNKFFPPAGMQEIWSEENAEHITMFGHEHETFGKRRRLDEERSRSRSRSRDPAVGTDEEREMDKKDDLEFDDAKKDDYYVKTT